MYAIVEIAGQQFKVVKDQKVFVNRLDSEEGNKVTFDNVLLLDDSGKVTLGAPVIDGAQVSAKVLKHLRGDKVIVFKKKRRKGYRVKNGHRQSYTEIQIDNIVASGAKPAVSKTEKAPAKPAAKSKQVEDIAPAVDLSKMSVADLKALANEKGISGISAMKKADLIAALS